MARSAYSVQVHQDNKVPSISSTYSKSSYGSSPNSTPRSLSPGDYEFRDPNAVDYTSTVAVSGSRSVSVYNHHKVNYDPSEPTPSYRRP